MKAFLKPVCADKEMLLATFYQELLTQLQKVESASYRPRRFVHGLKY